MDHKKFMRRQIIMGMINFLDEDGTFTLHRPENYSGLYFPVAQDMG